ncbi:unnamed protein product [Vitrella brassicaformis CCMP3155]|uniref:Uncharacterized protein n=1 Tax=Vitrella brassicaformis (strain CCMP3155) TaxID=1169540 RepID=A0A0G4EL24_VITBC|nr:unnamed protein product [Vitrella brassicaformis CCMP3155]|eukprot:CEL97652.1 unnamed protein product [Vitrella brassicaformis CCMP3155]
MCPLLELFDEPGLQWTKRWVDILAEISEKGQRQRQGERPKLEWIEDSLFAALELLESVVVPPVSVPSEGEGVVGPSAPAAVDERGCVRGEDSEGGASAAPRAAAREETPPTLPHIPYPPAAAARTATFHLVHPLHHAQHTQLYQLPPSSPPTLPPVPMMYGPNLAAHQLDYKFGHAKVVYVPHLAGGKVEEGWHKKPLTGHWEWWEDSDEGEGLYEVRGAFQDVSTASRAILRGAVDAVAGFVQGLLKCGRGEEEET